MKTDGVLAPDKNNIVTTHPVLAKLRRAFQALKKENRRKDMLERRGEIVRDIERLEDDTRELNEQIFSLAKSKTQADVKTAEFKTAYEDNVLLIDRILSRTPTLGVDLKEFENLRTAAGIRSRYQCDKFCVGVISAK